MKQTQDYKYEKRKKCCLEKVDDPRFAKEYKKNYKKNDKRGVSHLVKEEWHNMEQSIIAVTKEMTGGKKKHRNEEWYDDECWEAVKRIILQGKQRYADIKE